jgi:hypothetical protein
VRGTGRAQPGYPPRVALPTRGAWQARIRQPWVRWSLARLAALLLGGLAVATVRTNVFFDTTYYGHWAHGTLTGTRVPYRDFPWEYPPGALFAVLVPGLYAPLLRDGSTAFVWLYGISWVAFMLAVDAGVLRFLLRRTSGGRTHPATTVWIWGLPALGALCWARYDLLPAAAAATAVVAAGAAKPTRSGTAAGIGAALKLWPALLAPVQRSLRASVVSVVRAALVVAATAAATWAVTGTTGFQQALSYQSRRGLQCESLAALPLLWLRHLHVADGYDVRFRYGAFEVTGPHSAVLATLVSALLALGLLGLGLAHWRLLRRQVAGAEAVAVTSMALLLLVLLTDKAFSPQYVLWLLAVLAAACVLEPETWRPYVPWVLLLCGLTATVFPWRYGDVLGVGWFGLLALTARDVVLVGLAVGVGRLLISRLTAPRQLV